MNKECFYMVYAEGQNAPAYKHENEEKATKEAARLAEKLGVETTVLQAVATITPKDITARVKTYADACKVLGIEPVNEEVLIKLGFTKDEIAYRKLKTVVEALNEGWRPNWEDTNEYKYFPWFYVEKTSAGLSCSSTFRTPTYTYALIGSRLCFKTSALATFAAKQFIDLYNDFLLIKD